jgi:PTS system cellobiose-specific IIA component
MELENIVFNIILHAGNAKSNCFEALHAAKDRNFEKADQLIEQAKNELLEAHHVQTDMLQKEAAGEKKEVTLLLVHAEDHLMNAILAKDLIEEMIKLYKVLHAKGVEYCG